MTSQPKGPDMKDSKMHCPHMEYSTITIEYGSSYYRVTTAREAHIWKNIISDVKVKGSSCQQ